MWGHLPCRDMDDDGVRSWLEQRVSDHEFSGVAMVWREPDRECAARAPPVGPSPTAMLLPRAPTIARRRGRGTPRGTDRSLTDHWPITDPRLPTTGRPLIDHEAFVAGSTSWLRMTFPHDRTTAKHVVQIEERSRRCEELTCAVNKWDTPTKLPSPTLRRELARTTGRRIREEHVNTLTLKERLRDRERQRFFVTYLGGKMLGLVAAFGLILAIGPWIVGSVAHAVAPTDELTNQVTARSTASTRPGFWSRPSWCSSCRPGS